MGTGATGENLTVNGPLPAEKDGILTAPIVGLTSGGSMDFLTYGANGLTDATAVYQNHASSFTTTALDTVVNITSGNPFSYQGGQTVITESPGNNIYALRTATNAYAAIADGTTVTIGDGTNPANVILNSNGFYGANGGIANNGYGTGILNFGTSQGDIFSNNWNQINVAIAGTNAWLLAVPVLPKLPLMVVTLVAL